MNHEQFYWWVLGYAEANPDRTWAYKIQQKSKEVVPDKMEHQGALLGTLPNLPTIPDAVNELDDFMNLDNIPLEDEELPTVGSEIDTEVDWEISKGVDVPEVHHDLDKEIGNAPTLIALDEYTKKVAEELNLTDDDHGVGTFK